MNKNKEILTIVSPIDNSIIENIESHSNEDLNKIVENAKEAFKSWSKKTHRERAQVFYNYRTLLQDNIEELSQLIQQENGKTFTESKAEIEKAIEVTEFACSIPQICTDKSLEVSQGIHCRISKKPIGVVASITPFNFPSMVPHWTIPIALGVGNCMILKRFALTIIFLKPLMDNNFYLGSFIWNLSFF